MKYGYATDRRSETWSNVEGTTREEAAANAFADEDPELETVYICERKTVDKFPTLVPDVDNFLEDAEERASDDYVAIWHEDHLYEHGKQAKFDLGVLLERACKEWLEQYPGPDVWQAENITEHQRAIALAHAEEGT